MANVQTDKVVILARGLGTRMRRQEEPVALDGQQQTVASTGVKALIPVGRPFLDYVLSVLAEVGYRRVCLVVAPDSDALRDYYGRQVRPQRLRIDFAVQVEPRGTADAVAAAEAFVGGDSFLMVNSDNYYPAEALSGLRDGDTSATALFEKDAMLAGSNIAPERLRQFAVGRIDESGTLERIVEKPDEATLAAMPRPLWLSMNCWRFRPSIFEACRNIRPSARGEFEVTDAVQYSIDVLGERFRVVPVRAAVLDLTSRKDIAPVAAHLADLEVSF
jgi:dTDP-glucose pyrophosphorylase